MRSILVTGGCGFLGSHVSLKLLEKGYYVYIVDSNVNSSIKALESINLICQKKQLPSNLYFLKGDIRNEDSLANIFKVSHEQGRPIEGVIHFAGLKSVSNSFLHPIEYWDVNFGGTLKLVKVMDRFHCRTLIFSSSATVYGHSDCPRLHENLKFNPISPYAQNKAATETFLNKISSIQTKKWKIANLRYFNPIGAHESGLIGEDIFGKVNNIFPIINQVSLGFQKELRIFGNNWPTEDGTPVRDYIHVMDLADGHLEVLEKLLIGRCRVLNLNLGTGKGTSVLELIKIFQDVNKVKIPYVFSDRRKGDVSQLIACNRLAKLELDWEPKRNLNEMCKDGWNWYKKNLKVQ